MSSEAAIIKTDTITLVEGFGAMRIFLETVWRRHGKSNEEIEFVLGGSNWPDGSPADLTMWADWLAAVEVARSGRSASVG